MLPETPPGDAGLSLGVSVVKKITLLLMTMALAVAMVACSAAAGKPGETGPTGPTGPAGPPAETPDPTDTPTPTGEPGPVQMTKDIDALIFNDVASKMSTEPRTVELSGHFYPSTGLMYSVEGLTSAGSKLVDAKIENGVLMVMLKADAGYQNTMFMVKATDGTYSDTADVEARRNKPPMKGGQMAPAAVPSDISAADATVYAPYIWVTGAEMEVKAVEAKGGAATDDVAPFIYTGFGVKNSSDDNLGDEKFDHAHFVDDLGNALSFVSALDFADASRLMVVGAKNKITLSGKKTTWYDPDGTGSDPVGENPILVKLSAMDDGELPLAADPVGVFWVSIDMAPTKVASIGQKVLELGIATDNAGKTVETNVEDFFDDDRATNDFLIYYAWSDDPTVVTVTGNLTNKKNVMLPVVTDNVALSLDAKGRGPATITVKAVEYKAIPTPNPNAVTAQHVGAGMGQSVEQTFMVEVK